MEKEIPQFSPDDCEQCGNIQVSGTFADDGKSPQFRVILNEDEERAISIDAFSMSMARAHACGKPAARILIREDEP